MQVSGIKKFQNKTDQSNHTIVLKVFGTRNVHEPTVHARNVCKFWYQIRERVPPHYTL